MNQFWDKKFADKEYIYGVEPNVFLKDSIEKHLNSGSILFPGEGEGRNAVYAAQKGLSVVAFDQSEQGKIKALRLAAEAGVNIDYRLGDLSQMNFPENYFDAAALIYAHLQPNIRTQIHRNIGGFIKTGGIVILEAFSKNHVENQKVNPNAGGPRNVEMLYTKNLIMDDFNDFEPLLIIETEVFLNEGAGHIGKANVVRFIGRKN